MQKKLLITYLRFHLTLCILPGITPEDFLHKDKIVLDSVFITEPIIEVYHRPRSYNEAQRKRDDTATLYQRLSKQFKTISVNAITVRHGTLIHKDLSHKNKNTRFNDVSLDAKNLLIDSVRNSTKTGFYLQRRQSYHVRIM